MKQPSQLRWLKGRLTEGEYRGPFWGAKLDAAFLMIVPTLLGQYEVWCADVVFGERSSLKEAQSFAETVLGGYMERVGRGLGRLHGCGEST